MFEQKKPVARGKTKCFALFEAGQDPNNAGVREIVSRPTAYKYYKEWLLIEIGKYATLSAISGSFEIEGFPEVRVLKKIRESLKLGKDKLS